MYIHIYIYIYILYIIHHIYYILTYLLRGGINPVNQKLARKAQHSAVQDLTCPAVSTNYGSGIFDALKPTWCGSTLARSAIQSTLCTP